MMSTVSLDPRNGAVVAYLSHGRPPFSGREAAVRDLYGDATPILVAFVEQLLAELPSDPDWGPPAQWSSDAWENLRHAVQRARGQIASEHPDLSNEALDALSSYLAWNWK
jgi:hypothetical protein